MDAARNKKFDETCGFWYQDNAMDADEREIYYYLKSWKDQYVAAREICRRAGGKHKYRKDESWAIPALTRMVERGILETDQGGHYRIKPRPVRDKKRKLVSPQIARLLKESGKDFSQTVVLDNDAELDAYYESL